VDTWTDQAAPATNGTQTVDADRPVVTTSAQLGGKATVLFDGASDFLNFAALVGQPMTFIAAVHPITATGRLFEGSVSGGGVIFTSNTQIQLFSNGPVITATIGAYNNTGFILTGVWNGASSVCRKGGVQIGSGDLGSSALASSWKLGGGIAANFANVHVGEVLVYNRDLNASAEVSLPEKYLGTKFGVPA
jgi:hypothetical protein